MVNTRAEEQLNVGVAEVHDAEAARSAPSFGDAMDRLESVVAQLEGDENLGLEEALALYEQGVALASDCRERLAAAQLKLTEIPVAPPAE